MFFRSLATQQKKQFEQENSLAYVLLQNSIKTCETELIKSLLEDKTLNLGKALKDDQAKKTMQTIARAYAQLDGYDVMLRSVEAIKLKNKLKEKKSWWADVRVYAIDEEWQSEDGKLIGSHNDKGDIRPEYLAPIELYDAKDKLNADYLDPDCIEARGWNLSAGQYKPFNFAVMENEQSVAEMIRELQAQEKEIMAGLDKLQAMVGDS